MRKLIIYLSALSALSADSVLGFKHGAAQLRDLLAYPKYEIQFLNHLPVAASDAELAKSLGVETEEEWLDLRLGALSERRRLGDGQTKEPAEDLLELVPMSLVPPGSTMSADYLCLMPSKNSTESQTVVAEVDDEVELDPVQSWSALSHLDGKCLYTKLGWFTYSYCHNSHIRQFREARHHHPHPPGGYEPEEDTSYDAYTLGKAAQVPSNRRRVSGQRQADQFANPNPVSFGVGASSRYLVQRWSDGTLCDKTDQPREVEVQFHCSMTTNDVIYLVKEMAICQYVVIIHSPHICGLPGFKAPQADVEPAGIRCRQLINDEDFEKWMSGGEEEKAKGTLRLPWSTPGVRREGVKVHSGEEDGFEMEDADYESEGFSVDGLTVGGEDFLSMLNKALEAHRSKKDYSEGQEASSGLEDVVVLSLDEDEEGNVVLDTDLMEGDGTLSNLNGHDREMLLKVVKQFLEGKTSAKGAKNHMDQKMQGEEDGEGEGGEGDGKRNSDGNRRHNDEL